jgi:hypothetical protein
MGRTVCRIVAAIAAAALVTPQATPAVARRPADRSCGHVSFDYSVSRVAPGQLLDMDLGIVNCSNHAERLRLRVRSLGPCAFPHPVAHTYRLPAHSAVGSTSLILAPSCPGRYSVHLRITLPRDRAVLDIASDAFSVQR